MKAIGTHMRQHCAIVSAKIDEEHATPSTSNPQRFIMTASESKVEQTGKPSDAFASLLPEIVRRK
jgi:hypothetical protein